MAESKAKIESTKVELPEGVTPEMMKAWQERYGQKKVQIATLPLDDDGDKTMDIIVRVPDRKTVGEFEKWIDKNPDKAKEVMINACVLFGKEAAKLTDDGFFAAFDAVASLIPIRKAILKNY
ncbi:MAG: hypothetical protein COC06_07555 [Bacteroidales bacterium]|nr:MAG: hypothetical protein COC06_07555 [Bacteroidales bacterium]